uniref:Endonuclease/exonuclease/phosphatase domain-containing protein n=1 Tax=Latimeria chalumnae TaxID=7897 RepID=H3BFN6_LATCH
THLFDTRGCITGFDLITCNNHLKYGLACYVKQDIEDCTDLKHTSIAGVFTTAIRVGELTIINVHKPTLVQWPDLNIHPSIHLGDFNSHHTIWGYEDNYNGVAIVQWASLEDKFLLFDAKDQGTFHSSRWQREYNPDLCFLSKDSKAVLDDFPNSQHRPSIINVGIEIPVITSTPEPRWNFKKADWETFQKSVDTNIRWIPPTTNAFNRFIGIIKAAAKRSIPRGFRKTYIPCWMEESKALYEEHSLNKNPATATAMLESLNSARRERWKSLVEETNLHSLQQPCSVNLAYKHRTTIKVDAIASHLIQTSKAPVDKKFQRQVMRQLSTNLMAAPRSSTMSDPFTLNELNAALSATKSGKAAGPDGVYPEFLKPLGPKAKRWLTTFFSKVLATGKIPSIWRE